MNNNKSMVCINNNTYEDCLTIGKSYSVEIELLENNQTMYHTVDDNGELLQTMVKRFN